MVEQFPAKGGVSKTLSPRAIVHDTSLDFAKHCQLEYGEYVQVHEEHDNTMASQTTGAIALRPTGNAQGGYFFMSLATGRNWWTLLPMPNEVINRVHVLARCNPKNAPSLVFGDRNGVPIPDPTVDEDDDDDDSTFVPDSDDDASDSDSDDDDDDDSNDGADDPDNPDDDDDDDTDDDTGDDNDSGSIAGVDDGKATQDDGDGQGEPDETTDNPTLEQGGAGEVTSVTQPAEPHKSTMADVDARARALEHEMEAKYGPRSTKYGLRPQKPRSYNHLHAQVEAAVEDPVNAIALTHYGVKKGLKVFGEKGTKAVGSSRSSSSCMTGNALNPRWQRT